MKTKLMVFLLFVAIFSGCNPHYHRVEGERLYMYLDQPAAQHVELRCDFDEYQKRPARKNGDGLWEVSLPFYNDFAYFYIVDGEVFLPPCRFREMDDFGSENCIFLPEM